MVVVERLRRCGGARSDWVVPAPKLNCSDPALPVVRAGKVTEVVLTALSIAVIAAAALNTTFPYTSQSPAVRDIEATFKGEFEVIAVPPELVAAMTSPTLPAFALLLVVVPTMPLVCEGVKLPVDERVVKAPVLGATLPIPTCGDCKVPSTKAVVASCVVLVPAAALGAAGTPVKVGLASGAYVLAAVADSR